MAYRRLTPVLRRRRLGFAAEDLSVGGSVDAGRQDNPLTPDPVAESDQRLGKPANNRLGRQHRRHADPGVQQRRPRGGTASLASCTWRTTAAASALLGGVGRGHNELRPDRPRHSPVRLPVSGYNVQASYLLTGETTNDKLRWSTRAAVRPPPRKSFAPGSGSTSRPATAPSRSARVFDARVSPTAMSGPAAWTSTDTGVNWYLNRTSSSYSTGSTSCSPPR